MHLIVTSKNFCIFICIISKGITKMGDKGVTGSNDPPVLDWNYSPLPFLRDTELNVKTFFNISQVHALFNHKFNPPPWKTLVTPCYLSIYSLLQVINSKQHVKPTRNRTRKFTVFIVSNCCCRFWENIRNDTLNIIHMGKITHQFQRFA